MTTSSWGQSRYYPNPPIRPADIFRYGELPLWETIVLNPPQVEEALFQVPPHPRVSMDVLRVEWELITRDADDLLGLLLYGYLQWEFGSTTIDIGPLTTFDPVPGAEAEAAGAILPMGANMDPLEILARSMEFHKRLQEHNELIAGSSRIWRGRVSAGKFNIALPEGTDAVIRLKTIHPVHIANTVYWRPILRCVSRAVVTTG